MNKTFSVDTFSNPTVLLKSWKELRQSLTSMLSDVDHMNIVCLSWSHCPIGFRTIDWDMPQTWPDAWSLMYKNNFDESSIALAMYYTLIYAADRRWSAARCRLQLITDRIRSIQRIILVVDNRWLMNLEYKCVVDLQNYQKQYIVQQQYMYTGEHQFELNRPVQTLSVSSHISSA